MPCKQITELRNFQGISLLLDGAIWDSLVTGDKVGVVTMLLILDQNTWKHNKITYLFVVLLKIVNVKVIFFAPIAVLMSDNMEVFIVVKI